MRRPLSLRMRLTAIILVPTLAIAMLAGAWQVAHATRTAEKIFERSLLSAAVAIERDVAISGGDALSVRTRDLLADTSGGPVFYHVYAPDGVIVAGYATPPVGIPRAEPDDLGPKFFEARYHGSAVIGVRLRSLTQIDGLRGIFTTTVWQDAAVRSAFVWDLLARTGAVIGAVIAGLALVVWFGVRRGLRPLLDLEEAIARRSNDDLAPIRRPVPVEVAGIVRTLNRLFTQVSDAMSAQSQFIANAAHQLRNPVAGILSLAEAVSSAREPGAATERAHDLVVAARELSDLAQKLLLHERARTLTPETAFAPLALRPALKDWAAQWRRAAPDDVEIALHMPEDPGTISADATMLREAIGNLVDNALRHGGPGLSRLALRVLSTESSVRIEIVDDGRGMAEAEIPRALERFAQVSESVGSGLGLSIVRAVVAAHGGELKLAPARPGLRVRIDLPRAL